jgi:NAD(P)-dependent dehydrogenase (short-subunit alcohol dehydrogenase family)
MNTAIVIGVGPLRGVGAFLCRAAAKQGLHVVVAGRTPQRLDARAGSAHPC